MKTIIVLIAMLISFFVTAQKVISYKMPDGQVFSEHIFNQLKVQIEKDNLEVNVIDSILVDNTLMRIVDIKGKANVTSQEDNENFGPYGKFKSLKGSTFEISEYQDENGAFFLSDNLKGKPSIVNFWFTSCAPCIAELPHLLKLKNKYGDKLNYIAITFDDKPKVDKFLETHTFDFLHITNSKEQLNKLGVNAYPMTFVLDHQSKIFEVYGGLDDFDYKEIVVSIEEKLLTQIKK